MDKRKLFYSQIEWYANTSFGQHTNERPELIYTPFTLFRESENNINLSHLCTYLSFAHQWSVPGYIICTVVLRYKHRLPIILIAVAWTAYKGDNGFSFLLHVMAVSSTAQVQIQNPVSKMQATVGHTSAESIFPHLTNTGFWTASWKVRADVGVSLEDRNCPEPMAKHTSLQRSRVKLPFEERRVDFLQLRRPQ